MQRGARLAGMLCCVGLSLLSCTRRAVTPGLLVGKWTVASTARAAFARPLQDAAMTIVLEDDGRFVADEFPLDAPHIRGQSPFWFVTGSGKWRLAPYYGGALAVDLVLQSVTAGAGSPLPYRFPLFVDASRSSVALYYYRGDPDEQNRVYFVKHSP